MKTLKFIRGLFLEIRLIAAASGLAQTPMFFTHGTADDTVPIATARENVRHPHLSVDYHSHTSKIDAHALIMSLICRLRG